MQPLSDDVIYAFTDTEMDRVTLILRKSFPLMPIDNDEDHELVGDLIAALETADIIQISAENDNDNGSEEADGHGSPVLTGTGD